jgi:cyclase
MLKVRVIPTMLWKNLGLVKGIAFQSWRNVGTVLPSIKVYNKRDVDELFLLDISANQNIYDLDYESIEDFSNYCFVPFSVGGGIRHLGQIKKLLRVGADKVSLNSIVYDNPNLVDQAAKKFGSQCVVVSIDAKLVDGSYRCFSHSGTKMTNSEPKLLAQELEKRGAGEILITSIDKDGTMEGYDLELTKKITEHVNIPVIASGGAGNYQHMYDAIINGGASAVAAASMFHFTEQTPEEAKMFLHSLGVPVRLMFKE